MKEIRSILPHDCILVGQGINHGNRIEMHIMIRYLLAWSKIG